MEVSEIIKSLKSLIGKGTKVSDIEKEIGMPVNNLSSILKEKRVLPKKWIQPLEGYIENGKRKKIVLIEDENGNFICNGKKVKLVWKNDIEYEKRNNHNGVITAKNEKEKKALNINPANKNSYDGKKTEFERFDEVGQWEEPKIDNSEILKQIEAIIAEKIPKERDTILGRKLWRIEQDKRIGELKSKLIDQ